MSTDVYRTGFQTRATALPDTIASGSDARFLRVVTFGSPERPLAIVQYAIDGKEQEYGLRLDMDKRVFLDHLGDTEQENQAAREIVSFLARREASPKALATFAD